MYSYSQGRKSLISTINILAAVLTNLYMKPCPQQSLNFAPLLKVRKLE